MNSRNHLINLALKGSGKISSPMQPIASTYTSMQAFISPKNISNLPFLKPHLASIMQMDEKASGIKQIAQDPFKVFSNSAGVESTPPADIEGDCVSEIHLNQPRFSHDPVEEREKKQGVNELESDENVNDFFDSWADPSPKAFGLKIQTEPYPPVEESEQGSPTLDNIIQAERTEIEPFAEEEQIDGQSLDILRVNFPEETPEQRTSSIIGQSSAHIEATKSADIQPKKHETAFTRVNSDVFVPYGPDFPDLFVTRYQVDDPSDRDATQRSKKSVKRSDAMDTESLPSEMVSSASPQSLSKRGASTGNQFSDHSGQSFPNKISIEVVEQEKRYKSPNQGSSSSHGFDAADQRLAKGQPKTILRVERPSLEPIKQPRPLQGMPKANTSPLSGEGFPSKRSPATETHETSLRSKPTSHAILNLPRPLKAKERSVLDVHPHEQRVINVSIGVVDIRAEATAAPPTPQPNAPPQSKSFGFDGYAQIRSYIDWD